MATTVTVNVQEQPQHQERTAPAAAKLPPTIRRSYDFHPLAICFVLGFLISLVSLALFCDVDRVLWSGKRAILKWVPIEATSQTISVPVNTIVDVPPNQSITLPFNATLDAPTPPPVPAPVTPEEMRIHLEIMALQEALKKAAPPVTAKKAVPEGLPAGPPPGPPPGPPQSPPSHPGMLPGGTTARPMK